MWPRWRPARTSARRIRWPGNGEKMDETMAKKVTEDVAAYARTLASRRHRNVMLAEQAVNDSRAFTDEEALGASPPLIDVVARGCP